jgi:Excreted virulence factor EspC, type VII ESX diderm
VSTAADVQPPPAATLHQENCRRAVSESVLILTRVETSVRLDPVGLEWLAATCTCLADEIADTAPASTVGPVCQTTSKAVAMVHSNVAATRAILRERMVSTAAKLSASASAYVADDDNSAAEISAVGATLET